MAKLYIFGIGGTGARVMKSLTMLLASGVNTYFDIVPILIDPDNAGGDLNGILGLLKDYQRIQGSVNGYEPNRFFKNKISTLSDIIIEKGGGAKVFDGFRFELDGVQNDRFKDFLDFNSLDKINKNLAKLLFSEKNLNANLEVGFKGNPNIGSVVLNQFAKSEVFRSFAQSYQEKDRVFIISSIFGGTGAAGFPLLLKNIRKGYVGDKYYDFLKNAKIGAITVLPYFKVKQNDNSEIDSHGFIAKTKAALHYYARNITGNKSINALYYIADTADNTYENVEGGRNQKNDAHFIELLSALSIIDFASTEDRYLNTNNGSAVSPIYKEFGIKGNSGVNDNAKSEKLGFNDLFDWSKKILKSSLVEYFYFNLFLTQKLASELNHPYAREYTNKIDGKFLSEDFYKTLSDFNIQNRIWLAELSRNQISFSPFSIEPVVNGQNSIIDFKIGTESIFTLTRGIEERKNKFNLFAKNNYNLFIAHLNLAAEKLGNAPDTPKRFMGVFSEGTKTVVDKKLL